MQFSRTIAEHYFRLRSLLISDRAILLHWYRATKAGVRDGADNNTRLEASEVIRFELARF